MTDEAKKDRWFLAGVVNPLENLRPGRPKRWTKPEDLYADLVKYFEWCDDNPLEEEVIGWYQGEATVEIKHLRRVYTISGILRFLVMSRSQWNDYKRMDGGYSEVIAWADEVIWSQKFEGAAVGQFNPMLISRDLGIADRSEISGPNGAPIQVSARQKLSDFLQSGQAKADDVEAEAPDSSDETEGL